jgi:hypothetical protein
MRRKTGISVSAVMFTLTRSWTGSCIARSGSKQGMRTCENTQRRRGGKSSAGRVAVKPDDKGAARLARPGAAFKQYWVLFIGNITAAQPF